MVALFCSLRRIHQDCPVRCPIEIVLLVSMLEFIVAYVGMLRSVTVNDSQANFQLLFEGAVEKHKTCTMELITRSVEKRVKSVPLSVIEKARKATRYMMQRANTFILKHGGKP